MRVVACTLAVSFLFASLAVAELFFVTKWGSLGGGDGQFDSPRGVAVYFMDALYVVDSGNSRIQCFEPSRGTFIHKWGAHGSGDGQFDQPTDVAVDWHGCVYVTDSGNDRVQKFTGDGVYLTEWGADKELAESLNHPLGIALDDSGYVYVVDSGTYRVKKFTADGVFVTDWGGEGVNDGQFESPAGVTVVRALQYSAEVSVYVTDLVRRDFQAFTTDGVFVGRWTWTACGLMKDLCRGFPAPVRVGDSIWWVDAECHVAFGEYYTVGSYGSGDGQFDSPEGVAADEYGTLLWVADTGNHRIQVFGIPGSVESRSWARIKAVYR